jgi:hypothetical protein
MTNLPRHLRYLLDAEPGELSDYFPETAAGTLRPGDHEGLFCPVDGLCYVGNNDGTMVPIEAESLEEIEGNTFDPVKFSTLVHAIGNGEVIVQPGYADLFLEHGELTAQVRDGNHRTFAALGAGATFSWVMISDSTKQDIDEGLNDKLYKAIRAAQKTHGVPLLRRRETSKLKGGSKALKALQKAEREYIDARQAVHEYHQEMLRRFGKAATPHELEEQLERPQIFWRIRLKELVEKKGHDWVLAKIYGLKESKLADRLQEQIGELNLYDLRKAAGLNPAREKLDPDTLKIVAQ